jgi:hypothetical protein
MTEPSDPYLSIVAASRNDDHGGDLNTRSQLFVDGLRTQSNRFALPMELVLVEWNPPPERPPLREALDLASEGTFRVRVIEVPPEIHATFRFGDRLPMFQMIAKNVGIRRASAPFTLATNVDLMFSNELVRWLAERRLESSTMYRVDRYDVSPAPPLDIPNDERLEFCARHVMRINTRSGIVPVAEGEPGERYASRLGSAAWRLRWAPRPLREAAKALLPRKLLDRVPLIPLHTNTCGDFTLLATSQWHRLRGYAEMKMYSMHLDSLFCHYAHASGVKEEVLNDPLRIYHVDHSGGWTLKEHRSGEFGARYDSQAIPRLTDEDLTSMIRQLGRSEGPPLNGEDWGLEGLELPEYQTA